MERREEIALLMDNTLNADWSVDSIGRTGAFVTSISKERFLDKLIKLLAQPAGGAAITAREPNMPEYRYQTEDHSGSCVIYRPAAEPVDGEGKG